MTKTLTSNHSKPLGNSESNLGGFVRGQHTTRKQIFLSSCLAGKVHVGCSILVSALLEQSRSGAVCVPSQGQSDARQRSPAPPFYRPGASFLPAATHWRLNLTFHRRATDSLFPAFPHLHLKEAALV